MDDQAAVLDGEAAAVLFFNNSMSSRANLA
jgi:hypothetical protein